MTYSFHFTLRALTASVTLCTALTACASSPAQIKSLNLEQITPNALQVFNTPGMSVAVVHKGEVVHLQGYGSADLVANKAVTADTYFRLASASKAFTAASVAILIDEGKLNWDDKVTDYLPEFRLYDPLASQAFTIRDLLSHRSGLAGAAGDMMLWPEPSGFSREEVVHNLRYLTPQFGFRNTYAYSNVFYITAGELVARVSGMPWQDFVAERIFKPLDMHCYAGDVPGDAVNNSAKGYSYEGDGRYYLVERNGIDGRGLMSAAAGGIVCNATEMTKWLKVLLAAYNNNSNTALPFTATRLHEMWAPVTTMPVWQSNKELDQTNFSAYGLGWRMADMHGYKVVHHTGTLSGYQAHVVLVPDLDLGIVTLNNGSDSNARTAVIQSVLKHYLPAESRDWVAYLQQQKEDRQARQTPRQDPVGTGQVILPLVEYSGEFRDSWFGGITIRQQEGTLRLYSEKMPTLVATLEPFADHSFVVRWDNSNAQSPALISFSLNPSRKVTGFSLVPFRLTPGVSHEYRDMAFTKTADITH